MAVWVASPTRFHTTHRTDFCPHTTPVNTQTDGAGIFMQDIRTLGYLFRTEAQCVFYIR